MGCPFTPRDTHASGDRRLMCCSRLEHDCALPTWAYVLEIVRGAVGRLYKSRYALFNAIVVVVVVVVVVAAVISLSLSSSLSLLLFFIIIIIITFVIIIIIIILTIFIMIIIINQFLQSVNTQRRHVRVRDGEGSLRSEQSAK